MDISEMTVAELKAFATVENIDLGDARLKAEIFDVITDALKPLGVAEDIASLEPRKPNHFEKAREGRGPGKARTGPVDA